jgi:hypothetical protein
MLYIQDESGHADLSPIEFRQVFNHKNKDIISTY